MLHGYLITYAIIYDNGEWVEYTDFFHAYGKYAWWPYQIKGQRVGHLRIPIHVKKSCRYDTRNFIGPVKLGE